MTMKMPQVKDCAVSSCAYNDKKSCHAMAITVGDPEGGPMCDTFFESAVHGGVKDMTAGVGACKSADCSHNRDFECAAPNIHVGMNRGEPDCLSFEMR
ncbi:MAG TPA: DUF1540 domain-containing protein [Deferrimonas sp.]|jgi:hypothetical protein